MVSTSLSTTFQTKVIVIHYFICRNNIKSAFVQAAVIALGESLVFYIYAAGYIFGAYLVRENRAAYEDIFL